MDKNTTLTTAQAAQIDTLVRDALPNARYQITVPRHMQDAVTNAALDYWDTLKSTTPQYLDAGTDGGDIDGYMIAGDVDVEALCAANSDYEVGGSWLEGVLYEQGSSAPAYGAPFSLDQAREAHRRGVLNDLISAWQDIVRQAFMEALGTDEGPFSWPSEDAA